MKASKLLHTRRRIDRFHAGLVHEIAGPAYSGKSQLCYQEIITFLHHQPGLAVIIDVRQLRCECCRADLNRLTGHSPRRLSRR